MNKSFLAAALAVGLIVADNAAANTVSAADPENLHNFLFTHGVQARLSKDDFGDPTIRVHHEDTKFSIYFYGCDAGQRCDSIGFYAGYRTDGAWTLDHANAWNSERRFAKSYVSDKGTARLELEVFTGDFGLAPADFGKIYTNWTNSIVAFEDAIGW
ncbi:MAG: YbjN domain-containing protein [Planktomarina sp.]